MFLTVHPLFLIASPIFARHTQSPRLNVISNPLAKINKKRSKRAVKEQGEIRKTGIATPENAKHKDPSSGPRHITPQLPITQKNKTKKTPSSQSSKVSSPSPSNAKQALPPKTQIYHQSNTV
jgi:hypothetical protein